MQKTVGFMQYKTSWYRSQAWWWTAVIPALRRQRPKDWGFEVRLSYLVRPCIRKLQACGCSSVAESLLHTWKALGLSPQIHPQYTSNLLICMLLLVVLIFLPSNNVEHLIILTMLICISEMACWARLTPFSWNPEVVVQLGCLGMYWRYNRKVDTSLKSRVDWGRASLQWQRRTESCPTSEFPVYSVLDGCWVQNVTDSHTQSREGLGIKGPWHTGLYWLGDTCLQPISVLWSLGWPFGMSETKKPGKWLHIRDFSQFLNTSSYLWI